MFFADFLLSKRAPLSKVWMAAHWDRNDTRMSKLFSRAQLIDTNVTELIKRITEDQAQKLALRLSGHLLFGVVRIYSRKTTFLLEDCGHAITNIESLFAPGTVDLPKETVVANPQTITLPQNTAADIDMMLLGTSFESQLLSFVPEVEFGRAATPISTVPEVEVGRRGSTASVTVVPPTMEPPLMRFSTGTTIADFVQPSEGFGTFEGMDEEIQPPAFDTSAISDLTGGPMEFGEESFGKVFEPVAVTPAETPRKRKLAAVDHRIEYNEKTYGNQMQNREDILQEFVEFPSSKILITDSQLAQIPDLLLRMPAFVTFDLPAELQNVMNRTVIPLPTPPTLPEPEEFQAPAHFEQEEGFTFEQPAFAEEGFGEFPQPEGEAEKAGPSGVGGEEEEEEAAEVPAMVTEERSKAAAQTTFKKISNRFEITGEDALTFNQVFFPHPSDKLRKGPTEAAENFFQLLVLATMGAVNVSQNFDQTTKQWDEIHISQSANAQLSF